jgi:protein-S-isoprenylcysteine O-methyltransferase Ste14
METLLTPVPLIHGDAAPFTWPWALAFWLVYFGVSALETPVAKHANLHAALADVPTARWLLPSAVFASLVLAWYRVGAPSGDGPGILLTAGLSAMLAGGLLRRHCFRMLGASFTYQLQAEPGQAVIQRGAYAFIRHPGYLGGILVHAGFGLATGSLAAAAVQLGVSVLLYLQRIRNEERLLENALGDSYRQFMAGRKRLIPFVY